MSKERKSILMENQYTLFNTKTALYERKMCYDFHAEILKLLFWSSDLDEFLSNFYCKRSENASKLPSKTLQRLKKASL